VPPSAGPVSEQLNRVANKLVDFMRLSLDELFRELSGLDSPEATIRALQVLQNSTFLRELNLVVVNNTKFVYFSSIHQLLYKFGSLQIEMEKMQWRHQQEIAEYKRIKDTAVMEVRQMMEADKQKCIADLKKQWCANCGKEAIFYCCWNTSYCDYPCQVIVIEEI